MTAREAFGVVDTAIARATHLPVSYVTASEALESLRAALERLDEFEADQPDKENGKECEL